MPQEIRLWAVEDNKMPKNVPSKDIGLEKRLHDWLENDISMLDDKLLVIGREVESHDRQKIDLLCIDRDGALVVVEVKRRRTPREVAAQALDYASWVKDLKADQIKEIADEYLDSDGPLETAMERKFKAQPDTLNESHRSLIVAEEIDASTERIVRYLSELGVPINVATVQAFQDESGQEMLAQVFLVEPEVARYRARASSPKRRSAAEMQELANANRLGDLYRHVLNLHDVLKVKLLIEETHFIWRFRDGATARQTTLIVVDVAHPDNGGLAFVINATRFRDHLKIPLDSLRATLPADVTEGRGRKWSQSSSEDTWLLGAFHTTDEVDTFVAKLTEAVERLETD